MLSVYIQLIINLACFLPRFFSSVFTLLILGSINTVQLPVIVETLNMILCVFGGTLDYLF